MRNGVVEFVPDIAGRIRSVASAGLEGNFAVGIESGIPFEIAEVGGIGGGNDRGGIGAVGIVTRESGNSTRIRGSRDGSDILDSDTAWSSIAASIVASAARSTDGKNFISTKINYITDDFNGAASTTTAARPIGCSSDTAAGNTITADGATAGGNTITGDIDNAAAIATGTAAGVWAAPTAT